MKKLLIFSLFFLLFTLQVSGADGNTVCKIPTDKEKELINALEKLMFQHFTENTSNLPLAQIKPEHEHFTNNPDVYAFYNAEDNYLYFKNENIVNRLNNKYILHSVIHELTHFYQNNYGNKLPKEGTPDAIAMLMLEFAKEEVDKWHFQTAYKKIVNRAEDEINKLTRKINELTNKENATDEIKELKQQCSLWKEAQSYANNYGWENFKKAAIAEGTAYLMAIKVSGTFYFFVDNDELAINRADYLRIFIPIYMQFHPTMPVSMKKQYFDVIWGLVKGNKKKFDKSADFIALILKNYGNVLQPIEGNKK